MHDNIARRDRNPGAQRRPRAPAIVTAEPEPTSRQERPAACAAVSRPRAGQARAGGAPVRRLIAFASVLSAVFAVGVAFGPHSAHGLRDSLTGARVWAPIVVVAIYALLTCAMVPGPVLAGAAGLLFGTALGAAIAIISATLGATLAFLIARLTAHRSFVAIAGERLRDWIARIQARGFVAVLYARIAPGVPFALVSYGAGMTRVRLRDFALATLIGASPRAFAYAALGGNLGNYSSPEAIVALGVLGAMALAGTALLWRTTHRHR
jgi:uncharacterized membrane protein YdjX (TVP38/TMEM64 family)